MMPQSSIQSPSPDTALLLVNLGSPARPDPAAVRRYLSEFLSDPHVIDLPRSLWLPILHGFILPLRSRRSAAKYAKIWTSEGAPLVLHTERQAKLLKGRLGMEGMQRITAAWAMSYGTPALTDVLDRLHAQGIRRIGIMPLYPQYSTTTTASIISACTAWEERQSHPPELLLQESFCDHPAYIAALARQISTTWQTQGRPDKLVMSFHGLPQKRVDAGDPYPDECERTAQALAKALKLPQTAWCLTYQSRFGPAQWLTPATQATLTALAATHPHIDVVCPGFVADCLETLEEIAMECRADFLAAGGKQFRYLPCLNEDPEWIAALAQMGRTLLGATATST